MSISTHAPFATAPPAVGRRGMVATSQPLATQAGLALLRAGGSAVDAAIGANAVLAVTEPHMCGPGGDLFAMVWDPRARVLSGLNGSGHSPRGQSLDELRHAAGSPSLPARGPLTVTTPGAVAAWAALHARHGRLPWPALFADAIAIARDGFAVGVRTSAFWTHAAREIVADTALVPYLAGFRQTFLAAGGAPRPGETRANPALARLFTAIATDGASGFYTGDVAAALLRTAATAGCRLAAEDLGEARADWVAPLATDYRGARVHVLPPNGQGLCVLQMLDMLSELPWACENPDPSAWWHAFLEVKKLAFADRARYYADPGAAEVPISALLSRAYARRRAAQVDPARARGDQTPGDVRVPAGDTTYLAIADADGGMVSLIQSLFVPFGSALVVPEYGFALQSRGSGFSLQAGHPNAYAPAKRPFHTIMPGFVTRDGDAWLSFGAIGGDMQPQAQVQILHALLDLDCDVRAAGARARLRHYGGAAPNGSGEPGSGTAQYEAALPEAVLVGLRQRGHVLAPITDPVGGFTGGYQGIMRMPDTASWWGASDHRLDGCALGY